MQRAKTVLLLDHLAFRSGSCYYPIVLTKSVSIDGDTTYTIEMRIGQHDVIVTDGATLEGVLRNHEELARYAFATRRLQNHN